MRNDNLIFVVQRYSVYNLKWNISLWLREGVVASDPGWRIVWSRTLWEERSLAWRML